MLSSQATRAGTIDSFTQLLEIADRKREKIEESRAKITFGSRTLILHDCLDEIIKTLSPLKEIATSVAGLDPVHAGLPVAAFCFLMQAISSNSVQFATMVAGMVEIVPIIARWRSMEVLFNLRQDAALNQHFEDRLVSLYTNVIRYQLAVVVYFERGSASMHFDQLYEMLWLTFAQVVYSVRSQSLTTCPKS